MCIAAISSCKGLFFLIIVGCSLLEENYDDDPLDIFLKDHHHNLQLTMLILGGTRVIDLKKHIISLVYTMKENNNNRTQPSQRDIKCQ
jgi:hypothetical protein